MVPQLREVPKVLINIAKFLDNSNRSITLDA